MNDQPNILLISSDSLRADHLGCYGYHRDTSPNIDALAADSVLCEKMICPVIPTQPSHTTIFTGQHPLTHGVVAHGGQAKLGRTSPFLPEIFLESGYTTCAVDTLFRERIWFGRGFEYIIDPGIHHVFYANVTQEELNDRAIKWIQTVPKGPFFMFIHFWDPHYPYTPPDAYQDSFYDGSDPADPSNRELDEWWTHPIGAMAKDTWLRTPKGVVTDPRYVTALYDREIRYFDEGIARLRAALADMDQLDNTLIVLLADHGESMTEHRVFFDHYGLYDCTATVPTIISWPAGDLQSGTRMKETRQLLDIAPTLLDAAGIPEHEAMDGRSFFPSLVGEGAVAGYDEVVSLESTWQAKYCLRNDDHKFILAREDDLLGNPQRELYDLRSDPRELTNLADQQPKLAFDMEQRLESWIAEKLESVGKTDDPVAVEGASMVATWRGHRT